MGRIISFILLLLSFGVAKAQVLNDGGELFLPNTVMMSYLSQGYPSATTLMCWRVPIPVGITDATVIGFHIFAGSAAGTKCAVAIYQDSDSTGTTLIASTEGVACVSDGPRIVPGLTAFSLTAGTTYRFCTCITSTGSQFLSQNDGGAYDFLDASNGSAREPVATGSASTTCNGTTAAMPSHTGSLSRANYRTIVLFVAK